MRLTKHDKFAILAIMAFLGIFFAGIVVAASERKQEGVVCTTDEECNALDVNYDHYQEYRE